VPKGGHKARPYRRIQETPTASIDPEHLTIPGTTMGTVAYMSPELQCVTLWHQAQLNQIWGIPSPDGRHLTMYGISADANLSMMDNF